MSSRFRGSLIRHGDTPGDAVTGIFVTIERTSATEVTIEYDVYGDLDRIVLAPPGPHERRDALWTDTCFELFARRTCDDTYMEFNFAPSSAWAAYRFDGYRSNMRHAAVTPPAIIIDAAPDRFRMNIVADLSLMPPTARWRVGLSAVIRYADGGTSYWALAHPPGKPDFHHDDCFAIELAPSHAP